MGWSRHISTARVAAEKALDITFPEEWVDWANGLLERGCSGRFVQMLASMEPPLNDFEAAQFRDLVLLEIGARTLGRQEAVLVYARDLLEVALSDDEPLVEVLHILKDLYVANEYDDNLLDFYLLDFAHYELLHQGRTNNWPDATKDNIEDVIVQRAREFVASDVGLL